MKSKTLMKSFPYLFNHNIQCKQQVEGIEIKLQKLTSLLEATALSLELGAVTSANSHPVAPFARSSPVVVGWLSSHAKSIKSIQFFQ